MHFGLFSLMRSMERFGVEVVPKPEWHFDDLARIGHP
jgi:hypothetical protein